MNYPEAPSEWIGSKPEWAIYWTLQRLKINFTYQSSQMGGRSEKGGAVVDFVIEDLNLAINVQSSYYHYQTTEQRTRGAMQKAQLEGYGMKVIYIDEEDALRAPEFYIKEAMRGIDHSRLR